MLNEAETPAPGQTFTPKQLRLLKASVIIMGVLLVVGFMLLLVGIYFQASKIGKAPASSSAPLARGGGLPSLSVPLEPGVELREAFADQGRLILHLRREGKSEFAVIDLASGRETQRIIVAPRP
jgi:hypothetical protein